MWEQELQEQVLTFRFFLIFFLSLKKLLTRRQPQAKVGLAQDNTGLTLLAGLVGGSRSGLGRGSGRNGGGSSGSSGGLGWLGGGLGLLGGGLLSRFGSGGVVLLSRSMLMLVGDRLGGSGGVGSSSNHGDQRQEGCDNKVEVTHD